MLSSALPRSRCSHLHYHLGSICPALPYRKAFGYDESTIPLLNFVACHNPALCVCSLTSAGRRDEGRTLQICGIIVP